MTSMTRTHKPWWSAQRVAAAVSLACLLLVQPASAQSDGFQHTLELYLMGPSMSGTIDMGRLESEIDVPSSTVFDNLEFAALADYRGESDSWAVLADAVVMSLGASGTGSAGRGSADIDVDELIFEIDGVYRISSWFEVLAGVRYTGLETRVELTTPALEQEAEVSESWIDPVVGAQAFVPIGKAFQLQLRGDIGGFGVGCDFTWQATARVNWQVSHAFRLGLGYRWLDQDYESGSGGDTFTWNVLTQGPLLAAGVTF
jgi:hypothetical protein